MREAVNRENGGLQSAPNELEGASFASAPGFSVAAGESGGDASSAKSQASAASNAVKQECSECKQRTAMVTNVQNPVDEACHGTQRIGNLNVVGVIEHILIMQDYILNVNSSAELEYAIPGSSATGATGYADIVEPYTGKIWEIKPISSVALGQVEAQRYVQGARAHCNPLVNWRLGNGYRQRVLRHSDPNKELVVYQPDGTQGVIAYYTRNRRTQPQDVPVVVPSPSLSKQVKDFIDRVINQGVDAGTAAEEWLQGNRGLAIAILGLGIVGILALLADDLSGVGVADDVAIPPLLVLLRVAGRVALGF